MGLRDFRWVNDALPGKLGLMDIDGTLTQAQTGRVLMLELKPAGAYISKGARLTYKLFVRAGFDVWVVWDHEDGTVERGHFDRAGNIRGVARVTQEALAAEVVAWWEEGL
jgi:hypothetical protein